MTEEWAKKFPSIQWSVMHPGWADTPAVRSVMMMMMMMDQVSQSVSLMMMIGEQTGLLLGLSV